MPAHVDPTDTSNLELHRSFLQFTLSADASVLFVHGTGGEDRGLVKVVEVEAEAEGGKKEKREVKVEVEARFTDEGLRDAFSVVKMVHDSEEGVGIYVSDIVFPLLPPVVARPNSSNLYISSRLDPLLAEPHIVENPIPRLPRILRDRLHPRGAYRRVRRRRAQYGYQDCRVGQDRVWRFRCQ